MTILIASTNWWPNAARLAIALKKAGARIAVVCPAGNPVLKTRAVSSRFRYGAFNPQASLEHAIAESNPDYIIPTDEYAVQHIHGLYAKAIWEGVRGSRTQSLIETSMGTPEGYSSVHSRGRIMEIAREEDILIPDWMAITSPADLEVWGARQGFPWVIKSDGTCAGTGVRIVSSITEARKACRALVGQPSLATAAKRLFANRDPFPMRTWLDRTRPSLTVQSFVPGSPANCAVVCWKGEVLAGFSVAVDIAQHPTGAASVVRIVDNPGMLRAAERIARRLGISGFCGLDFMLDSQTGDAHFVELNPRATQLCHLPLGPGRDLTAAFYARLSSAAVTEPACAADGDRVAIFPNAWRQGVGREVMDSSYQDVPWGEPGLISELVKPHWPDRRVLNLTFELVRNLLTQRSNMSKYFTYRGTAKGDADPSCQSQRGPAIVR